jgi:hypothetical protein
VPKTFDTVSAIMAYEQGELGESETLELFAHLIRTGLAWSLQGSYGRAAWHLISTGMISPEGKVLHAV